MSRGCFQGKVIETESLLGKFSTVMGLDKFGLDLILLVVLPGLIKKRHAFLFLIY